MSYRQCLTHTDQLATRQHTYKLLGPTLGLVGLALAVFILMPAGLSFASTSVSGILTANTDWTLSGSPYVIDGQVQVSPDIQLTIDPGVQVQGGTLTVWGTLSAVGSANHMVGFQGVLIAPGTDEPTHSSEIDLSYCTIDCTSGGSIYTVTAGSNYGTLSLCDSVIVDAPYIFAWYPTADCFIERNVFNGCGGIQTVTMYPTVYVRNNVFYNSTGPIENYASYNASQTIVEFNTFMMPEVGASPIALKLFPSISPAAMDAQNNFWETTDEAEIASRIYDRSVDLACAGYIPVDPILTAPDPATPALITRFTPASGAVGSAVTLSGGDFTSATAVRFNGVPVSTFTVDTDTQITATVPAGATSGLITVTTAAGNATSAASFTVVPAPTVSSFVPTSGPLGTVVTLTGTDFTNASAVAFHGTHAVTFNVVNTTHMTATVPAGATTGTISVTTPSGTGTSAAVFTVMVTPKLTLKLSGLAGGALKPGKPLTAKGTVAPSSLASDKVILTVQRKQSGQWHKVTRLTPTIGASGAYSDAYKPAKTGSYRIEATVAKTATNTAAATNWLAFKVK